MTSVSYNIDACCGADCYYLSLIGDDPCWGDVKVIEAAYTEDDHWWIHACQGHKDCWYGGQYIPEKLKLKYPNAYKDLL